VPHILREFPIKHWQYFNVSLYRVNPLRNSKPTGQILSFAQNTRPDPNLYSTVDKQAMGLENNAFSNVTRNKRL